MKKWTVKSKTSNLPAQAGKDEIIDFLLKERGIDNEEEKEFFLNPPPPEELVKEFSQDFKDQLLQASNIIKDSIQKNVPIVIHGDYDADGICSTTILFKVISEELAYKNVFAFIPNRFNHGYGLSKESVDESVERLKKEMDFTEALLITVDTGITAVKEVNYAKSKGFKVVIADHHQKPDVLPGADCILWSDSLVGAGVVWFLAKALGSKDKNLLQYAATGTVTDLQALLNFNRSIVREGLALMNKNPTLGIKKLIEVAGRKFPVSTYDLGWVIGPRLNATGRIGDATDALNLLVTNDEAKALISAKNLNELNFQRQEKTLEMFELVESMKENMQQKIIFTANKDYHEGIIGLVAAKLVQTHYRPSIVVSLDGEFGKGSVRSISGFDIIAFLRNFEEYFESLGGHPMAAGFTINTKKLEEFKEKVIKAAEKEISEELLTPALNIDVEISLELVNMEFIEEIEQLRPFGIGNKNPIFLSKEVGITGINFVGKEKNHVALKLLSGGKVFRGIYFKGMDNVKDLEVGDKIDLVYSVEKNEFRNNVYVNLVVKDLRKI